MAASTDQGSGQSAGVEPAFPALASVFGYSLPAAALALGNAVRALLLIACPDSAGMRDADPDNFSHLQIGSSLFAQTHNLLALGLLNFLTVCAGIDLFQARTVE